MIFRGLWLVCDDSTVRPVIRGEVLAANGDWVKVLFLLDTGADRTVFSANVWEALGQEGTTPTHGLAGPAERGPRWFSTPPSVSR